MKLEDIPKEQPFEMPDESHFDKISSKIYAQLELEELKSETKAKRIQFWAKPHFIGIAATLILLLVALVGIYKLKSNTNSSEEITISATKIEQLDFSKIPTEQINTFLLEEDISETELLSFIPPNSNLEILERNFIFEKTDLNSIDEESLDLMLEEEYL